MLRIVAVRGPKAPQIEWNPVRFIFSNGRKGGKGRFGKSTRRGMFRQGKMWMRRHTGCMASSRSAALAEQARRGPQTQPDRVAHKQTQPDRAAHKISGGNPRLFAEMERMTMGNTLGLQELRPGQRAVVWSVDPAAPLSRRLLDLGFVKGTEVRCLGRSPFGDPSAYGLGGTVLALRAMDGAAVTVTEAAPWD